jgi:hypothetical protein
VQSLRALIGELQEAFAPAMVTTLVREILDRFFGDQDLPTPKLKFSNSTSARWLARCKWYPNSDNSEIEVQKSALGDEKTLRRVLTHELIHHWQYLRTDQFQAVALAKLGVNPEGHGTDFMQYAAKINATMGADYVSKTSDQSYDTSEVPAFYILVQPHSDGRLGYSVALRPSAKQKVEIHDRIMNKQGKLFRITDGRFWMGAAPIKRLGGYVLPKDPKGALALALRDLYATGDAVNLV